MLDSSKLQQNKDNLDALEKLYASGYKRLLFAGNTRLPKTFYTLIGTYRMLTQAPFEQLQQEDRRTAELIETRQLTVLDKDSIKFAELIANNEIIAQLYINGLFDLAQYQTMQSAEIDRYITALSAPLFLQLLEKNVSDIRTQLNSLNLEQIETLATALNNKEAGPLILAEHIPLSFIVPVKDKDKDNKIDNTQILKLEAITQLATTLSDPTVKPLIEKNKINASYVIKCGYKETLEIASTIVQNPNAQYFIENKFLDLSTVSNNEDLNSKLTFLNLVKDDLKDLVARKVLTADNIAKYVNHKFWLPNIKAELADTINAQLKNNNNIEKFKKAALFNSHVVKELQNHVNVITGYQKTLNKDDLNKIQNIVVIHATDENIVKGFIYNNLGKFVEPEDVDHYLNAFAIPHLLDSLEQNISDIHTTIKTLGAHKIEQLAETLSNPQLILLIKNHKIKISAVANWGNNESLNIAKYAQQFEVAYFIQKEFINLSDIQNQKDLQIKVVLLQKLKQTHDIETLVNKQIISAADVAALINFQLSDIDNIISIIRKNESYFKLGIISVLDFSKMSKENINTFIEDLNQVPIAVHQFIAERHKINTEEKSFFQLYYDENEEDFLKHLKNRIDRQSYLHALCYPSVRTLLNLTESANSILSNSNTRHIFKPRDIVVVFNSDEYQKYFLTAIAQPSFLEKLTTQSIQAIRTSSNLEHPGKYTYECRMIIELGEKIFKLDALPFIHFGYFSTEEIAKLDPIWTSSNALKTKAKLNILLELKNKVNDPIFKTLGFLGKFLPDGIADIQKVLSTITADIEIKAQDVDDIFTKTLAILERKQTKFKGPGNREDKSKDLYKAQYLRLSQFETICSLQTSEIRVDNSKYSTYMDALNDAGQIAYNEKRYLHAKYYLESALYGTIEIEERENLKIRIGDIEDILQGNDTLVSGLTP